MASQYNVEPQPTAKVILNTTAGDLTLELFGKQTPLATRNFLQHCLDGYYNGTIFHRLLPGFIIQGGDPTGTGSGGISAVNNGEPFEDEFHSRLKFNRRGLLGMANEGKDSNTSQFFFTLGTTAELQGKNTMFGRIEGDTIYNLMKMADAELSEGSERPLYPTRITGSEILVNPFPNMVARTKEAPRTHGEDKAGKGVKKRKKPAGKNILSFGAEDGEEGIIVPVAKKSKVNPKVFAVAETHEEPDVVEIEKPVRNPSPQRSPRVQVVRLPSPVRKAAKPVEEDDEDAEDDERHAQDTKRQAALDRTNAEIAALKASMKRTNEVAEKPQEKPRSALEALIPTTSTRGRKRGKFEDETGAMDMFKAFRSKLDTMAPSSNGVAKQVEAVAEPGTDAAATGDEEAELCDLHFIANCQSCKAWDDEPDADVEDDGEDESAWMSHQLTFAKDTLGKDLEWRKKMDEIEVIDPLEKARAIKEEGRKKGSRKK
ncbi:hypothetical protein AMS68_004164 [Peltaster fructicola]|uniref:PPIase cyclophilin-type domain-containing protein n=1 Tax=Peltaster fructicola TaxID=286661 RepID=A0A6H0XV66_9PEZI|nr:hypothetical protein AMS68_004164 [Peltaster fructicola]